MCWFTRDWLSYFSQRYNESVDSYDYICKCMHDFLSIIELQVNCLPLVMDWVMSTRQGLKMGFQGIPQKDKLHTYLRLHLLLGQTMSTQERSKDQQLLEQQRTTFLWARELTIVFLVKTLVKVPYLRTWKNLQGIRRKFHTSLSLLMVQCHPQGFLRNGMMW